MEFSRQEHWSGLPFPPPEDLPDPGIEPASPALADKFFIIESPGYLVQVEYKSICLHVMCIPMYFLSLT